MKAKTIRGSAPIQVCTGGRAKKPPMASTIGTWTIQKRRGSLSLAWMSG